MGLSSSLAIFASSLLRHSDRTAQAGAGAHGLLDLAGERAAALLGAAGCRVKIEIHLVDATSSMRGASAPDADLNSRE